MLCGAKWGCGRLTFWKDFGVILKVPAIMEEDLARRSPHDAERGSVIASKRRGCRIRFMLAPRLCIGAPNTLGRDGCDANGTGMEKVIRIGSAQASVISRPFDEEDDRCFPSSFEDYAQNKCWICQEPRSQWDLWLSCRHLFCRDCSTQMLRRGMPCPLCRVVSSSVLRGTAYPGI